jgi:uncharacterized membrane protein
LGSLLGVRIAEIYARTRVIPSFAFGGLFQTRKKDPHDHMPGRLYDRGWVAKVMVAFTVIVAVVLIATAIILPHHG